MLTGNALGTGSNHAFACTMASLTVLSFPLLDRSKTLSNLRSELNDLNNSYNNAEASYNHLENVKTYVKEKTNENTSNLDKKETINLEQVFKEVLDEEITLEEKPKVRTRK